MIDAARNPHQPHATISAQASVFYSSLFWAVVVSSLALDFFTKWFARRTLVLATPWPSASLPRLRLLYNEHLNAGATVPGGSPLVYTLLGLGALAIILAMARRIPRTAGAYVVAVSLMVGGSGNVLERALRGKVTDFIDLGHGSFNVADILLTVGLAVYTYARTRDGVRANGWRATLFSWRTAEVLPRSARTLRAPIVHDPRDDE